MLYRAASFSLRFCQHQVYRNGQRFIWKDFRREYSQVLLAKENYAVKTNCRLLNYNQLNNFRRQLWTLDQRFFSKDPKADMKELMDTFPIIVNGNIASDTRWGDISPVVNCFKDLLERTVPKGQRTRGITCVRIYKRMEDPENLSSENIKLANILGWCIEMLFTNAIILDDLLDNSEIRRRAPCWHKNEDVGMRVVFDSMLLVNYMFEVVKIHFSHLPIYVPIIELLHESQSNLAIGQIYDSLSQHVDINRFTRERYQLMVRHTTRPTAFELPYTLAYCLANKFDRKIVLENDEMITKLNTFYQAQNDFLDVYNESDQEYKTGNDIEEGKFRWVIAAALEKANPEQRLLLQTHYGKKNPESVQVVKKLFNDLEIPKVYALYEREIFDFINENFEEVWKVTCPELMFKRLDKYYNKYI